MSGTRFVMVVESPFTRRDEARFRLDVLDRRGVVTEVWDVSRLLLPNANRQWSNGAQFISPVLFEDFRRFEAMVNGLSSEDVLLLSAGIDASFSRVMPEAAEVYFGILVRAECRIGALTAGSFPALGPWQARRLVVQESWRRPYDLISKLRERLLGVGRDERRVLSSRGQRLPELDFIWADTNIAGIEPRLLGLTTRVVYIHSLDYDQVLAAQPSIRAEPLTTFIDCMGPSHPDYSTHTVRYSLPMNRYRDKICSALDALERSVGFETVVAAHPRAQPGSLEQWYGGREVRYQETAALVSRSSLVATADPSTAVGLAVALGKPLLFFTSTRLQPENRMLLRRFSHELRSPLVRIEGLSSIDMPTVNSNAYERYMERYVKRPGTPAKAFWEVAADDVLSSQRGLQAG